MRPLFLIVFFLLVYLLFPTNNSVNDAWSYAASVKWGTDLFKGHHLLYNAFGRIIYLIMESLGLDIDALALLKAINAFFGASILGILYLCGNVLRKPPSVISAVILLVGSSFAVIRYSTEGEAYIIPVFFISLATYYFIKWSQGSGLAIITYGAISAAVALLFHQVVLFWWAGIFFFLLLQKAFRPAFIWVGVSLLVPLVYALVSIWYFDENLWYAFDLALHDFTTGEAEVIPSGIGALLFVANIFRLFFQVHGYMMIYDYFLLTIIPFAVLFLVFLIRLLFSKEYRIEKKRLFRLFAGIAILQLMFALVADGNYEFMVMVPVLGGFILFLFGKIPVRKALLAGIAFFLWNFMVALLPAKYLNLSPTDEVASLVGQDTFYLVQKKYMVENIYYYRNGKYPANLGDCYVSRYSIDSLVKKNQVCTDCYRNMGLFTSRASVFNGFKVDHIIHYSPVKADSVDLFRKTYYIHCLSGKND